MAAALTAFDEVFADDGVRAHYRGLIDRLDGLGSVEIAERAQLLDSIFRSLGITFAVEGHTGGQERTWPMDLVPRIISAGEWRHVAAGLQQRVAALNAFLEDLYVGEQAAINDGVIPRWLRQPPCPQRDLLCPREPRGHDPGPARCLLAASGGAGQPLRGLVAAGAAFRFAAGCG